MKKPISRLPLAIAAVGLLAAGTAYAVDGKPDKGPITRAEAQTHATEMFTRMDANKDGKIDQADRAARQAAMFDRIDTDKDGQISRAEFTAHHQQMGGEHRMGGKAGGEHRMGHGRMGHGKMDHGQMGHGRMDQGGMMHRMADTNGDGAISQAEFTTAALQRFDRADANKDGIVTVEERRAAHDAMRQEKRQQRHDHRATTPAATN
ncbi:MAG: EF-hand domain-containing protein [Novosphingobium sp.]